MSKADDIIGVILAGGQSSRMGKNKALLEYNGQPLLDHMIDIIRRTGISKIVISGKVEGYESLFDDIPFSGPAQAIMTVIKTIKNHVGFLCVPVDMPLIKPEILHLLMQQKQGAYFHNLPLPAFIAPPYLQSKARSVQDLLNNFGIKPIILPKDYISSMANINTPQEWKEIVSKI